VLELGIGVGGFLRYGLSLSNCIRPKTSGRKDVQGETYCVA